MKFGIMFWEFIVAVLVVLGPECHQHVLYAHCLIDHLYVLVSWHTGTPSLHQSYYV